MVDLSIAKCKRSPEGNLWWRLRWGRDRNKKQPRFLLLSQTSLWKQWLQNGTCQVWKGNQLHTSPPDLPLVRPNPRHLLDSSLAPRSHVISQSIDIYIPSHRWRILMSIASSGSKDLSIYRFISIRGPMAGQWDNCPATPWFAHTKKQHIQTIWYTYHQRINENTGYTHWFWLWVFMI